MIGALIHNRWARMLMARHIISPVSGFEFYGSVAGVVEEVLGTKCSSFAVFQGLQLEGVESSPRPRNAP